MRTTMILPQHLIDEARQATGLKSKTETVVFALEELIRRKRMDELKSMFGSTDIDIDVAAFRERPPRTDA